MCRKMNPIKMATRLISARSFQGFSNAKEKNKENHKTEIYLQWKSLQKNIEKQFVFNRHLKY